MLSFLFFLDFLSGLDLEPLDGDNRAATLFGTFSLSRLSSEITSVVLDESLDTFPWASSLQGFEEVDNFESTSEDLLEGKWSADFELLSQEEVVAACDVPTDDENTEAAGPIDRPYLPGDPATINPRTGVWNI